MMDHSRIDELIAVRALGGLDPEDEAALTGEMAEHGSDCAECRRLDRGFSEVAGRLGFALDLEPVREGLEEEVLAVARDQGAEAAPPAAQTVPPRRSRIARGLVTVAAALALFFAGWVLRDTTTPGLKDALAHARLATFQGSGGELTMLYRPGETGVVLVGSGFASPHAGHVYELWRIQDETPIRTGCFTPGAGGKVESFIDAGVRPRDVMAVTEEPSSCPDSPTTKPILTTEPLTA